MKILAAQRLRSTVTANVDVDEVKVRLEKAFGWKSMAGPKSTGGHSFVFQGPNVPGKKFEIELDARGMFRAYSPLGVNLKSTDADIKKFLKKVAEEVHTWSVKKEKQARSEGRTRYGADLREEAYQLEDLEDALFKSLRKL